jgi:hypothetical protein
MTLFFQFLVGHALGDFVFQSDMMAMSKGGTPRFTKRSVRVSRVGIIGWFQMH